MQQHDSYSAFPLLARQMRDMPPWFKCLVWMEVALQLPFFFVGAYAFLLRRNWIRTPALLYGINVTSTMVRRCSLLRAQHVAHHRRWSTGSITSGPPVHAPELHRHRVGVRVSLQ